MHESLRPSSYDLAELIEKITPDHLHEEIDFDHRSAGNGFDRGSPPAAELAEARLKARAVIGA